LFSKHVNDGRCQGCIDRLNLYGTDDTLRSWFIIMQAKNPEVHVSVAGRNEADQEACFNAHKSRSHFGESPHNYTPSLAIDLFRIDSEGNASWSLDWYKENLVSELPNNITWGGKFKGFVDGPHFEVNGWNRKPRTKIWR
jgi:hypothetical protein